MSFENWQNENQDSLNQSKDSISNIDLKKANEVMNNSDDLKAVAKLLEKDGTVDCGVFEQTCRNSWKWQVLEKADTIKPWLLNNFTNILDEFHQWNYDKWDNLTLIDFEWKDNDAKNIVEEVAKNRWVNIKWENNPPSQKEVTTAFNTTIRYINEIHYK